MDTIQPSETEDAMPGREQMDTTHDDGSVAAGSTKRRRWWLAALVALLLVGAVAAVLILRDANGGTETAATVDTVEVVRTDLVVTETLDGTLGYTEGTSVLLRSASVDEGIIGRLAGTVTAVPEDNSTFFQGDVVYEVNGEPVVLLDGELAAHRTLSRNSPDGPDILQLESALVTLGFDPDGRLTVDEDFTSTTEDIVEDWQEANGANVDGVVGLGEVIFSSRPLHVSEVLITPGDVTRDGDVVLTTSTGPGGTLTAIATEGGILEEGAQLFRVDDEPITLLYGDVPAYRSLALGVRPGNDVAQLEAALARLGFDASGEMTIDDTFDAATEIAVVAWQESAGAVADAVVDLGEVVFLSGPIRVSSALKDPGDPVHDGDILLTTSSNETFVVIELDGSDQGLVAVGDPVTVELPDGTETTGIVTAISTVAQTSQNGTTFFEVTIELDDPNVAPGLDEAPVDVFVVSDSAANVLAVPVTALLALLEGGYAVEIVDAPGTIFLVSVDPGLYADGLVEVTSGALEPGMRVVVP